MQVEVQSDNWCTINRQKIPSGAGWQSARGVPTDTGRRRQSRGIELLSIFRYAEQFNATALHLAEYFEGGQMPFGEGQMTFWEGPNCRKKLILSMQRHRHKVKILHRLEGAKSWFQSLCEGHGPVSPHPLGAYA